MEIIKKDMNLCPAVIKVKIKNNYLLQNKLKLCLIKYLKIVHLLMKINN